MTLQPADHLLLSVDTGGGEFVPVAGLRTRSVSLRSTTSDSSDASSGSWRQLLAGAGLRQASVAGAGAFLNDAAASHARAAFFAEVETRWRIDLPDAGAMEGPFHVVSLDVSGKTGGEADMSISLISSGALHFVEAG